jgi:hypothetical protein
MRLMCLFVVWTNAAETHETFRRESGMRYQFRPQAPISSVNRGSFVAADSAVPSFVPSNAEIKSDTRPGTVAPSPAGCNPAYAARAMSLPDATEALIRRLPKVELHLHIEGTFEPEMVFEKAAKHRVTLAYPSIDALRAAYDFSNLQSFLDILYGGCDVLRDEQDFYDISHSSRAAGCTVTGRFAELGVPEHVIPIRMRREAHHNRLAQLAKIGREAGHFIACYPGVDEQHAGPALHDNAVVLE